MREIKIRLLFIIKGITTKRIKEIKFFFCYFFLKSNIFRVHYERPFFRHSYFISSYPFKQL